MLNIAFIILTILKLSIPRITSIIQYKLFRQLHLFCSKRLLWSTYSLVPFNWSDADETCHSPWLKSLIHVLSRTFQFTCISIFNVQRFLKQSVMFDPLFCTCWECCRSVFSLNKAIHVLFKKPRLRQFKTTPLLLHEKTGSTASMHCCEEILLM